MYQKITNEELANRIMLHQKWLFDDNGERLCLIGYDLSYHTFEKMNLTGAILKECYLRNCSFNNAQMGYADISYSAVYGSSFYNTNLSYAGLTNINFIGCDLRNADIRGATIDNSIFIEARFLPDAFDYNYDTFTKGVPISCPETGSFIGYKKAKKCIVKLKITEDALRSSATRRKCRCNKAEVISITDLNDERITYNEIASDYDENFLYTVGETVQVENFDTNRWNECSTGIHFYITRDEAKYY